MKKIILLTAIFSAFLFHTNAQDDINIFTENIVCFPNGTENLGKINIKIHEDLIEMLNPGEQFFIGINGPGVDLEFFTEVSSSSIEIGNEGLFTIQVEDPDGCVVSGVVEVNKCNAIPVSERLYYIDCKGNGGAEPGPDPGSGSGSAKQLSYNDPSIIDSYSLERDKNSFKAELKFGNVYPNPVFDGLKLEYFSEKDEVIEISLIGVNGSIGFITDYPIYKGDGKIDISIPTSIVNGIYSLIIRYNNEIISVQKVTIIN